MNIERGAPWRLSLERRDNARGYARGNVAFVCAEFNTMDATANSIHEVYGSAQWSEAKIRSLVKIICTSAPLSILEIDALKPSAVDTRRSKCLRPRVGAMGKLLCTKCGIFKRRGDFAQK